VNRLTQSKNTTVLRVLTVLTLACFAVSPTARAVDPPPDGGYPNQNTAEGENALFSLTTGDHNTAVGFQALFSNTTGDHNTAIGSSALQNNTKGIANTAIGLDAMKFNTTGKANVAFGVDALIDNSSGFRNTAIGTESLKNTTAFDNIGLGYEAGKDITTGSFNICIGNPGVSSDSNMIRIGTSGVQTATFIAGISGVTVPDGVGVIIDNSGKLGTTVSSARYKEGIKPMDKASEAILALKPVTFHYRKELDPNTIPQYGLVAEQVEKVNPDLVARDAEGKPYTVRYEAVNAMLLNEFLKEHRSVQELKTTVAQQQKEIENLTAALKAQAAQIQKVSDQIRAQAPASRVVAND
jgi:trimeric autotransporter adhesin